MLQVRRCHPLTLLLATACGSGAGNRADRSAAVDSAGVTITSNSGPDHPLGWRLDSVATIGGGGSDIRMSQLTEYTVDADSLGHIYVIDSWYGDRIQLIDTTGHLLRALTRHGGGPGEIGEAVSISASGDGTLGAMDFTKTGIVRLRWDGTVLPLLSMAGYELFGGGRVDGDTVVFHTLDASTKAYAEQLRYRTNSDTATLVVHIPPRLGSLTFCRDQTEGLTPMLTPGLTWTTRGSEALVNHTAEYRIDDFHAGRLVRSIRRTVPSVAGTVETVRRFFPTGKIVGRWDCIVPAAELAAKRGIAPTLQPIRRIALDWNGEIWAERNTFPDEVSRVDVYDRAGRYLGTLNGFGAPLGFPSRDLLLFARADSTGDEPRLTIYRLTK